MTITLQVAGLKDTGKVRELNEDEFFYKVVQSSHEDPAGLFIVSDGIGGQKAGEVASEWAIKAISDALSDLFVPVNPQSTRKLSAAGLNAPDAGKITPTRRLIDPTLEGQIKNAIQRANDVVRGIAQANPAAAGDTGTTVTMAVIKGEMAYIANVGDSRTYLFRRGELIRITQDHSLVMSLVLAGQLEIEEIYTHPKRNLIYRSLGGKPDLEVDVFPPQALEAGDQLLLCSDGLWEMVRDPQITKLMKRSRSPKDACKRLVDAANKNGGQDNISVLIISVDA